ncbi:hypothetical protein V3W47_11370 [Deinococcus sp. YIM 134068]|uniref:hypothetical protein n=1 Tax=Deinococcus lichenicola TaxID=3118910 RepID=UPI002F946A6D
MHQLYPACENRVWKTRHFSLDLVFGFMSGLENFCPELQMWRKNLVYEPFYTPLPQSEKIVPRRPQPPPLDERNDTGV